MVMMFNARYLVFTGASDDPLVALSDVLNTDDDLLGILSEDLAKSADPSGISC